MNFEPQKFFIGMIDFFSILLPGLLVAHVMVGWVNENVWPPQNPGAWILFLTVSYLAGHIAFLIGSLLDKLFGERVLDWKYLGQLQRLSKGKPLSWAPFRFFANAVFGKNADGALISVVRLKMQALQPIGAEKVVNAYQWSKAILSQAHSESLVDVERFEAHSKFFRSFCVVNVFIFSLYFIQEFLKGEKRSADVLLGLAIGCIVISLLLIWGYLQDRFKAQQKAYWMILTLKATPVSHPNDTPSPAPDEPTHAGGVVVRKDNGVYKYLLVEARKKPDEWVLPKGRIDFGETPAFTAVREVKEETDCWARAGRRIEDKRFDSKCVRFFLMTLEKEVREKDRPLDSRRRKWVAFSPECEAASFDESKEILRHAYEMVVAER